MDSKKAIISGIGWSVILNIVNGAYGFISVPLLISYYGKSNYGLIVLAMSVNVYLRLLDMGLNTSNVRFYSSWIATKDIGNLNKLFTTSISLYGIVSIINAIILLLLSLWVESIFPINHTQGIILQKLLIVLGISAIFSWHSSCLNQIIMASEQVGWVQKMTILPKIVQFIILGAVYIVHLDIVDYFLLSTFSIILVIPFSYAKIYKDFKSISFVPTFDVCVVKDILPYCINIFSFSIFQFSQEMLRPIILGIRVSADLVAEYKVIGSIVTLAIMVGGSFMGAILPSASKAMSLHNITSINKIAYQGTKYITISLCFAAFGLITIEKELIIVYVGRDYLNLLPWLTFWLLCTLFSHNQGISSIILAGRDIKVLTYSSAISCILCLVSCWFLIPYYNVGAPVIGYFLYCLFQFLFYYIYYWRVKLKLNTKRIFLYSFMSPILGAISSFVIVYFILYISPFSSDNIYLSGLMKGAFFVISFIPIQYALVLSSEDRKNVKSMILKLCRN